MVTARAIKGPVSVFSPVWSPCKPAVGLFADRCLIKNRRNSEICVNSFSLRAADLPDRCSIKRRRWANLTVADQWLDKQGWQAHSTCSSFPWTSWWNVGGHREQMCPSHLSAAAVDVFLSKILKTNRWNHHKLRDEVIIEQLDCKCTMESLLTPVSAAGLLGKEQNARSAKYPLKVN